MCVSLGVALAGGIGLAASAAGSAVQGVVGANSAAKARRITNKTTLAAMEELDAGYEKYMEMLQPYQEAGFGAFNQYLDLIGLGQDKTTYTRGGKEISKENYDNIIAMQKARGLAATPEEAQTYTQRYFDPKKLTDEQLAAYEAGEYKRDYFQRMEDGSQKAISKKQYDLISNADKLTPFARTMLGISGNEDVGFNNNIPDDAYQTREVKQGYVGMGLDSETSLAADRRAQLMEEIANDPMIDFYTNQANKNILAQRGATGMLEGSRTADILGRIRGDVAQGVMDKRLAQLQELSNMGLGVTNSMAGATQGYGANIANLIMNQGNNNANAAIAQGNAIGGSIGGLLGSLGSAGMSLVGQQIVGNAMGNALSNKQFSDNIYNTAMGGSNNTPNKPFGGGPGNW